MFSFLDSKNNEPLVKDPVAGPPAGGSFLDKNPAQPGFLSNS